MALDVITGASCVPAAEILSQITEGMLEVASAANNVLIKRESFMELAGYLERVVPILKLLNKKDLGDSEALSNAIQILNREIKAAKQLTVDCTKKSRVYLLMNSRAIMKNLEDTMKEISRALGLLPLASLDISSGIVEELDKLCDNMMKAELKAAVAEEEILEKVESAIQERNVDCSYASNLVAQIAEAVGISTERSALKKEFEEFKGEIENVRLRKDEAEAIQMDQIIALLERADVASSPEEKEMRYITKRNSLGTQPFEPLQSFFCPITRDVMEDPVETSSGHTFERSAIEKWLADGNHTCPLTMIPIHLSSIRPNKTLRQSIEEWKDRNTIILIASIKSKLVSKEEEEVLDYLGQLEDLCKQRDKYCEWVILENYIPTLIQLLSSKSRDIRIRSLSILNILTKDNVDAKERISNVDNAIESIVRFLGRRIVEGKLAVSLLLELSKCSTGRDQIGKAQGCILLLVTMSRNDDKKAAADAQQLLENLSVIDQNIIQMAKANYFRHFLQRIETGPEEAKMLMVSALAEMELTDNYKAVLFEGGVLGPLRQFVSDGDIEIKRVAVKALRNLSSLPSNGLQMIREGASGPLLNLLFRQTSSASSLREEVAATILNLAISTVNQESSSMPLSLLQSDDDTIVLFSLISLTGPNVQHNILRTFHALCQSPKASDIKTTLTEYSAMPLLAQLCEHEKPEVRSNAVKLLCCLVEDGDEAIILEHLGQRCLESLLKILRQPSDLEEIASTIGIISNLPEDPQMTQYLLDNEALTLIGRYLHNSNQNDPHWKDVVENAAGALCRFTVPTNLEWQKRVAEIGIIPVLVHLLDLGTTSTKKYAAISLARLSQSSDQLTQRIRNRHSFGRLFCFSDPGETTCIIHGGICAVQSSFCLVKAHAIDPLIRVLEDPDPNTCEASLDALLTLIEGEKLQKGCSLLAETNAIPQMIKLLGSSSLSLQEKTLNALERIFRLPELTQKYGSLAQLPLVDLTQRGNGSMKSLSARILAHLNVLHNQSSYF